MHSDPPESAWEVYDYSDTVLIWKMENGRLLTVPRNELQKLKQEGWYFLKYAEDRTDETTS